MKRYSLGLVAVALILVLGSMACAKFPDINKPDSSATFYVQQGFAPNGNTLWFFCTDTNDINFASTMQFPYRQQTLASPLTSAYNATVNNPPTGAKMFINVSVQQGPLFTAVPTQAVYSGIWSVEFIRFLPGKARVVSNTAAWNAITNPQGFPVTAAGPGKQADLLTLYGTSRSGVVVDCPIVAVGVFPKSGVWFQGNSSNSVPLTFYRLPQVIAYNLYYKTVTLPAWYTYCQESISKYIDRCTVIIPDVQDTILAARLKANLAPGLGLIDEDNAQDFTFIDGRTFGVPVAPPPLAFVLGGPTGPLQDVNQLPIIEQCPTGHGAQNTNRLYTPYMEVDVFEAGPNYPLDPLNKMIVFVNNATYAEFLEDAGVFLEVDDEFINAPVLDCSKILPPSGQCCIPGP